MWSNEKMFFKKSSTLGLIEKKIFFEKYTTARPMKNTFLKNPRLYFL